MSAASPSRRGSSQCFSPQAIVVVTWVDGGAAAAADGAAARRFDGAASRGTAVPRSEHPNTGPDTRLVSVVST